LYISYSIFQDKVAKELKELKGEEKLEKIEKIETNQRRTPVKLRIKKNSVISPIVDKDMMSKTMGGFFKPPSPRLTEKVVRPKSSYKENRKEITEEEEDYLRTTFHPGVKWKII